MVEKRYLGDGYVAFVHIKAASRDGMLILEDKKTFRLSQVYMGVKAELQRRKTVAAASAK